MQKVIPIESIMSRTICEPITLAMCSLTGDGGAAAVLCNEEFVKAHNLQVG